MTVATAPLASSTLEDLWFGGGANDAERHKAADSVAALVAKIHGVKPLPVAAQKLIKAARDPETTVERIASILESDPGLLSRVLRMVNSAAYGLRTPCKTARAAVTLLGSKRIAEVASASAVLAMFDSASPRAHAVLEHALGVAGIMKRIATRCNIPADDAFTCGLLHDLGQLMQLQVGDGSYEQFLEECLSKGQEVHERELEVYGFDHGILAGYMLQQWEVPEPLPQAVALHHHMARVFDASKEVAEMVHLIGLSDQLVVAVTGPRPEDAVLDRVAQNQSVSALGLTRDDLISLWEDLHKAIERSRRVLAGGSEDDPDPDAGERDSGVRRSTTPEAGAAVAPRAELVRQRATGFYVGAALAVVVVLVGILAAFRLFGH
jgi:HD-like signal output (HDOD) protein